MRKILSFLSCILLVLPLLGCWDRKEVNDIAIVMGSSFDKGEDNNFIAGVIAPLPGQMGGPGGGGGGTSGDAPYYLDAGVGKSIRDAYQNLQQRMPRRLMLGHRRVAIFGEDLAREGIGKSIDVLTRTREARLTMQIFVAEGEALEVLAAEPQLETLSAEAIREIGITGFEITLRDFLLEFQQKGNDPIIPVVVSKDNVNPVKELVRKQVEINKLAIFKGDKLVFTTNQAQTLGATWLMGKLEGKNYAVEMEDGYVAVEIVDNTPDIQYRMVENKPEFTINLEIMGNVIENMTDLNLEEQAAFTELNEAIVKQVKSEVTEILDATLSEGIDNFGFGWLLHRRERKKWKELRESWREILPDIEYEVNVNCSMKLPGLVTEGIGIGE